MKEPSDPAQVISESAFYRMNLQKDEQKIKDYTNKLLASKNREAIKAKRSRLTARKEQASRPSKQVSTHSDGVEVLTIHDEEPISYNNLDANAN